MDFEKTGGGFEKAGEDHFIIGDETFCSTNNKLSRLFVMSVPSGFQKPVS